MRNLPYPVYDADNHLYEPAEAFTRHLPDRYRREFQYVIVEGRTLLAISGQITTYIPNPTFEKVAAPGSHEKWYRADNPEGKTLRELTGKAVASIPAYRSGAERLPMLDEQGIHASLVFPTLASVIEERMGHDHDLMAAVMHSLAEWTRDEWGFARDGRIFAVPMISLADVGHAVKELEWALASGARAVGIRPAPVPGYRGTKSPAAAEFDAFWARVAEAGIFACMHSSDSGYDRFDQMWAGGREYEPFKPDAFRAVTKSGDRAIYDAFAALITHGLFHRHPNLRVISVENGAGWVAPLFKALDFAYRQMPQEFTEHPHSTFRRHIFVAPFYEESFPELVEQLGEDRILFGSDYPHPEGLVDPLGYLDEMRSLSAVQQQKIMSDNLKGLLLGERN